ncbi:hypothetical protein NFI96_000640, partial [Prochilodus magdalenae]
DEMVRDRVVIATNSPRVREKLLSHGADLTLEKAIDIARSYELAQAQLREMVGKEHSSEAVHTISRKAENRRPTIYRKAKPRELTSANTECGRCGGQHGVKDACPAKGKQCLKCKKLNHFAKMCKTKSATQPHRRAMHSVVEESYEEQAELYIDGLTTENAGKDIEQAYAEIEVATHKIKFKIDTGAQTNAIPEHVFQKLFKGFTLQPATQRLTAYGAQDEFQRRVDETYEGLSGVTAIVDDILVAGKTKQEHDDNLRAMLQRTRERGVRLNPDKCQICVPEVSYFGHTLSSEGIKPDPMKVKAIQEMQPPKNRAELETILGMVNYLARFTSHLSQIKDLITHHPVLAYFDPLKELRLQVDASKCGLGAVMLQGERPVAYASKSLNSTEENYAQIEKEIYAVLFGCKPFHEYMYGRRVIVESDHKPLEAILRKPLAAAPPRLQRMILQLQRYDIHIIHRPGKEIPVADILSRKSIEHHDSGITEGLEAQVHTLISNLPVSKNKLQEIREATAQDTQLTTLRNITKSGWPDERKKCPLNIQEFWNHRDEIVEIDGILFKGEKIIIPHTLRADMIHRIHTGHMGIEKSKSRACDILFWPGMGKQIEASVAQCDICQERRSSNTKEPLLSHAIPERPWQVVGTDLLTWNSQDFVIIADYYSRYFEIEKLTNCTSSAVITKLKAAFARHGIPETVISDNGPCYSSTEFRSFSGAWDFRHITTSPRYPRSNGLAKRTVQTAKHILDKAKAENIDHYLGLLEHRNTPVDNLNSPAQLLMSRRLRSILPTTAKQLQPQVACQEAVRERREVGDSRVKDALNHFYARFGMATRKTTPPSDDQVLCLTAADVRKTLRRVDPRKATGPDNIPARVLRECADQLTDVFTNIFNISLSSAIVPTCLKATTIIPVPKKSSVSCLNDYRPVALTPIIMKCFERLVMRHIKTLLPSSLDPLQFAYRPNRSTDDTISTTLHLALTHLDNRDTCVRMMFIDFSSAFNTIIPQHLIRKLNLLGLNTSLSNWILDFLTGRPQSVQVGRNTFSTTTLSTGAPQGCVLSPLLFTWLTHDCAATHSSNHIKFADDTTVVGLISKNDESAYREEVQRLMDWCRTNNLSLNIDKTKEMVVDFRRTRRDHSPLHIDGSTDTHQEHQVPWRKSASHLTISSDTGGSSSTISWLLKDYVLLTLVSTKARSRFLFFIS